MLPKTLEERGRTIAKQPDQIQRLGDGNYKVASQSGNGFYAVVRHGASWTCECPDHTYREVKCKHIWAVELSLAVRREVQAHVIRPITIKSACTANLKTLLKMA